MDEKRLKLYVSFFLISLDETTSQLLKLTEDVGKDKVCDL